MAPPMEGTPPGGGAPPRLALPACMGPFLAGVAFALGLAFGAFGFGAAPSGLS